MFLHYSESQSCGVMSCRICVCEKLTRLPSVFYHSVRIVLNLSVPPGIAALKQSENAREICLSSAQDILALVRKFRTSYELSHVPLIFVYGLVQAFRACEALGIVEESNYSIQTIEECAVTWSLAQHVQHHMQHGD